MDGNYIQSVMWNHCSRLCHEYSAFNGLEIVGGGGYRFTDLNIVEYELWVSKIDSIIKAFDVRLRLRYLATKVTQYMKKCYKF